MSFNPLKVKEKTLSPVCAFGMARRAGLRK
jgi:hypothetical protein